MTDTAVIGVDWGTSSLRAFRLGKDATILERRAAPLGILAVPDGDFAGALTSQIGDWADAAPDAPIVMSGMIGSRQGWAEAPYCPCPAGAQEIANRMISIPWRKDRPVWIAPGLTYHDKSGVADVMRGEEVQIIGAADALGSGYHVVCLPGTHSKWAIVDNGRITSFSTHMTGEVFDVLRRHSILGRMMPDDAPNSGADHDRWFLAGIERANADGGLLHHLFANRAQALMGDIPAAGVSAHLSGLLIGHEIGAAAAGAGDVSLLGAPALCRLYALALEKRDIRVRKLDADSVVGGLMMLAQGMKTSR